jgi:hypothetical protein
MSFVCLSDVLSEGEKEAFLVLNDGRSLVDIMQDGVSSPKGTVIQENCNPGDVLEGFVPVESGV